MFGLSCYQLLPERFGEMVEATVAGEGGAVAKVRSKPKIFMGHGEADPLVRFEWGLKTAEGLKERGFEVDWNSYKGLQHGADPAEIDALEKWVVQRFDETTEDGKAKEGAGSL